MGEGTVTGDEARPSGESETCGEAGTALGEDWALELQPVTPSSPE